MNNLHLYFVNLLMVVLLTEITNIAKTEQFNFMNQVKKSQT